MNSNNSTMNELNVKFKETLIGLLDRISIVCVRLDKIENPKGLSSYDKVIFAKIAINSLDTYVLLKYYDNIFSKYRSYIEKRDIMFFKQVQLYPNIPQETIDFIFRMFDKEYGLKDKEKLIIWKCLDKLIYYIDKIKKI